MSLWDVIVVGAGMAGALVAERLIGAGYRVLLLDAGPRPPPGASVHEADPRLWSHRTARLPYDCTRVRAVGGRGHVWGGWCSRLPAHAARRAGVPFSYRELSARYAELEGALGVVEGALDDRYRRLARELELRILPKRGALVREGKVWTPLALGAARRARTHQVALSLDGSSRNVEVLRALDLRTERVRAHRARAVVLAASPLETTRILLTSALAGAHPGIGRGLVDHMVASYVLLEPRPPPRDAHGVFPGAALVDGFVNVDEGSRRPYPGGFTIEVTGPLHLEALGVDRMVPGDEIEKWSGTAVHALGELAARSGRKVDLDPGPPDMLGRRVPRVHFSWSRDERVLAKDLARACAQLADALALPGSRLVRLNDPLQPGAGHEAGTCAAGRDASFPCDPWGALRGADNVWIADASAMRTATDRHPTLTLLAHALRVADSVGRHLERR